ncbi:MAG: GrpB family protein, partial [Nocardioides sp.]
MPTHPLWNAFDVPSIEEIEAARVELAVWTPATVQVVPYDPTWPQAYAAVRDRVIAALGDRVLRIEHVGSTSVPGLWAKPVIDADLTVADSGDEDAWLPELEAAGFVLRVREPDWEEHRCLRGSEPTTNLHVFSPGAREPQRHRLFRDWLRAH